MLNVTQYGCYIQHNYWQVWLCESGWWVELRVGPSLFGRKVTAYTNLPEEGKPFSRKQYRALSWTTTSGDSTSKFCRLPLNVPGSYHYYFVYDDRWLTFVINNHDLFVQNVSLVTKC